MSTFRKDPFGPAWVLISPERGLESSDFGSVGSPPLHSPLSPGADGSLRELDARRPTGSRRDDPHWRIRVVAHPNALVRPRAFDIDGDEPFRHAPSHGRQEIVIEHPDARERLETFSLDHLVEVLRVWRGRLAHLAAEAHVRHVQLTRAVGEAAGAVYAHPHSLLLASPLPNRWVEEEISAAADHHAAAGSCLFCDVARAEAQRRERIVATNADYVAIAPYASKTPFETWILPRRHGSAFGHEPTNDLPRLAEILQSVVRATCAALDDPPYNLLLHTMPTNGDGSFHWHIEILPRLTRQAGFDWANGFYVNPTPPEVAARFLREAMALQEAT